MRTEITRVPADTRHITEWVLGVVGVLAAAVGAYMFYVPANWVLAGLAESWYLGMFVGAGLFLAATFGVFARRMYLADRSWTTQVVFGTGLMVLAFFRSCHICGHLDPLTLTLLRGWSGSRQGSRTSFSFGQVRSLETDLL